jgi:Cdc6-like AAA superfamily ATPase
MESMERLRQSLLDAQNIQATLPTDVLEGGVIFCKLCKEIYANNFVLSEVTDLNRNVIFEHGYAMAVRRQGLLLRNSTRISQEFSLLKDVEQVYYENRGDIISHVAKFEIDDRDPVKRSLRLIGMCQTCEIEERYNLVYFLKNGSRSDAVRSIDRFLRKQPLFDMVDDNPNDVAGHEVHQYCKRIQQARYVVAHFVSDKQKNHQTLNARVAFLMGLAMGFGKRILILQERPVGKKMIDLKGVIREYDRESVAKMIVQEWLGKQNDYVIAFKKLQEETGREKKRRVVTLRDLDFGPVAAEKDFDLPKYFVETPYYKRAQRGDRTLFLGRRGSGKTAMFRILSDELKSPNNVVVKVAPRDYELLRLEGFLAEKFSTAHWRFVYGSIWRNVLLTEIVQAAIEQHPSYIPPSESLVQLLGFRDKNKELFERSFADRLTYIIEQLQTLHSYSQISKNQEQLEQILKSIRFREVEEILKELVQQRRTFVLIDHLDENWSTENEQTCLLLAALIHEADRLNTDLTPGLRIIVFLRSDIFDVVRLRDSEIDKRSKDIIQWNRTLLAEVVARRIAVAKEIDLADRAVEEIWHSVFCNQVSEEDTISYIISRTLLRPRDVLQFCNRCLEEAQNQRHDYVQEDDVLHAEGTYSEDKILDLFREYHIGHPDLIELLWLFKELPREIEELKIGEIIEEAQNNPESLKEASEWVNNYSTDQLIEFLYDIGFIGVKSKDGEFVYSYDKSLEKAMFGGLQMVPYEEIERVAFTLKMRGMCDWFKQSFGIRKRVSKEQRIFSVHSAFRKDLRIR